MVVRKTSSDGVSMLPVAARVVCLLLAFSRPAKLSADIERQLSDYLHHEYEIIASEACNNYSEASWMYQTDVENKSKVEQFNRETLAFAKFEKQQWEEHFKGVDWKNFQDETLKRQLRTLSVLGVSALNDSTLSELNGHQTNMTTIYSSAKICPYQKQNCDLATEGLALDPGMQKVLSESRDYDELVYVWKAWRDVSGAKMRDSYKTYVELSNLAAHLNGFKDNGEMWRYDFEDDHFVENMMKLWEEVKPLYLELHTYVKRKLRTVYGDLLGDDDLIPAHVLGNMWAQSWENIFDIVKPFPSASLVNVTSALTEQGYTPRMMFETSDEFYQSLGLPENTMSYNESVAMIQKPQDGRVVVCHASAWDFCTKKDFRIKMCTNINMEDFITIHHEMGHIQYYIQYKNQPYALRAGANPGFHEAVGDTIALSVSTPEHLKKIGLLQNYEDSYNSSINALMLTALQKVAFLPFGLLIDMWRWDVFSGKTPESQWNAHWWELRESVQKVKSPIERSESDFDPGAKYHVPADSQYISYFVAHILQFQFHKSLCIAAGQYDPTDNSTQPLHKCDIFQSNEAGKLLSDGLKLGGSQHWNETLYVMTGEREMSGSALLEYFQPLYEYLKKENSESKQSGESYDPSIAVIAGCVVIGIVVVVCIGYVIFRRRALRRSNAA